MCCREIFEVPPAPRLIIEQHGKAFRADSRRLMDPYTNKVKSLVATSIGRNDPCPCGSGRKHKKCCLREGPSDESRMSLSDQVAAYALRSTSPTDLQTAWEEYGETGSVKRPEPQRFLLFMDWVITGRRKNGKTLLQMFEDEHGANLNTLERTELEKHKATHNGIYEVTALHPGKGVTVKDIFTGDEIEVADVSTSHAAAIWDVLVMRLRRLDGPAQAWGEAIAFSPLNRDELKFELEGAYRTAKVYDSKLDWQAFLDSATPLLRVLEAKFRTRRKTIFDSEHVVEVHSEQEVAAVIVESGKRWVDEPVPALGGRTPRQAAADLEARRFLADLLKEYERNHASIPDEDDFSGYMNIAPIIWMRTALGLPIPKALTALQKRLVATTRRKRRSA